MRSLLIFSLLLITGSNCNREEFSFKEKSIINQFLTLVSNEKFQDAKKKVGTSETSVFSLSDYNLNLLKDILKKKGDHFEKELQKTNAVKKEIEGLSLEAYVYEITVSPKFYDTSVYASVKLNFCFDRELNKDIMTYYSIKYDQKSFRIPTGPVKIRKIFDDNDTL